ncbi:MAG: zinc ribbon domain-containing protein [bacterium]
MPLYEYVCDECNEEFESIQSVKDRNDADCPACGKRARRVLSGFTVGSSGGGGRASAGGSYGSGASCTFTGG